jgi:hypothetical protein
MQFGSGGSSFGIGNLGNRPAAGCRNFIGGLIAGPILILIGVGAFYFLGGTLRQAYTSTSWPTVQGQIVRSEVAQHRDSDGDQMYNPVIDYSYTVNNQSYGGSQVTIMDGSTSVRSLVQDTVKRYPSGTAVTVYYDPDDPANAVLEPGLKGGVLLLGGLFLCFPAMGVLVIFGALGQLLRLRFLG